MAKIIILLFLSLTLIGCSSTPERQIEIQYVDKPVLYCPAPNWEQLSTPELAITDITDSTPDGEVAKRYKATIKQLQDYVDMLVIELKKYDDANQTLKDMKNQKNIEQ